MKKLKKSLALITAISLLATLTACGKGESLPEGMSQELYDTAVNVLKIMDKYNDADIDSEEAENRLDALYDKIDNMDLSGKPNKDEFWSESERALIIKTNILSYEQALSGIGSSDTYTIADELREELKTD